MKMGFLIDPKVIYDIGANCLHWTKAASRVWPDAQYIAFEATDSLEFLYWEAGMKYHMGVLSDVSGKEVNFYQNDEAPSGNSYYKENVNFSPDAKILYSDDHIVKRRTITLDEAVKKSKFPLPDLIKMDIQGAELDVLKGATKTLKHCKDLILELQHEEYNIGSPHKDVVIKYLDSIGFKLVTSAEKFDMNEVAGDYHFTRK
jgi:FkbM family methyltransferase